MCCIYKKNIYHSIGYSGTLDEKVQANSLNAKQETLKLDEIKLNPCYLHLSPNKATCPDCKNTGKSFGDRDILRKMLLPPTNLNRKPTRKFQV